MKMMGKKVIAVLFGFLLIVTTFPQTFAADDGFLSLDIKTKADSVKVYQLTDEGQELTDSVSDSCGMSGEEINGAVLDIQKLDTDKKQATNTDLYEKIIGYINTDTVIKDLNRLEVDTYLITAEGYVPSFVVLNNNQSIELTADK